MDEGDASQNPDVIEYVDLGKNTGGNIVDVLAMKLPAGLKNREFLTMTHERVLESSAQDGGATVYERISRSTTHPDRPIEFSTEDKVNNPNGVKRKFIRAYAFDYVRLVALEGGASCERKGLTALDMRGDFPTKVLDTLMFEECAGGAQKARKALLMLMAEAGYQPMPAEKIKMEKKKK